MPESTRGPSCPPDGDYANYFRVGHNAFEFVLDFGQFYPENDDERFHTRVVTSPVYAKAFAATLRDSIVQYEHTFGAIPQQDVEQPRGEMW